MTAPTVTAPTRAGRTRARLWLAGFVALVYVPILSMDPGKVEADTKSYLYFDAGRLLARVGSVWDPSFGMGTLTHQTIGYLFPMGPWFWFFQDVLGLPSWVAQRLWLATIIVAAGFGVRYLLRALGVGGPGVGIGMLAYSFTPYVLGYAGVYSLLLGPWAALPWWIAFVMIGLRRGGWKYPALLALTIQLVGSLNGSALGFAMVGPALWLVYAVVVEHETTWRRVWSLVWRTGVLALATSLWWLSALAVEGKYGVNILRFTESLETVSVTSYPFEVLRGLGYWFFYGRDVVGPWNAGSAAYTHRFTILLASFAVPALAVLAAAFLRWRERAYFVLLVVIGTVLAVGAAPYEDPSPLGSVFKSFALGSKAGFALRNTNRAAPLVVLGLTVLLAVGVTTAYVRLRARDRSLVANALAAAVAAVVLLNALPALAGAYYNDYLERDEAIPEYWRDAIAALDAESHATRVFTIPGADFATYRWGDTRDPVEPGFMDRPYVARELVPWGSEQSAAFLMAVDRRIQEGALEPDSLAAIARLMGVGDIVVRSDLATDRWGLIPAGQLWKQMTDPVPEGLGAPEPFGTEIPGELKFPELGDLSRPAVQDPDPPPVARFPVEDAVPVIRSKSTDGVVVVDGDAEGIVDVAAAGLLDRGSLVLNSPSLEHRAEKLRELPSDAALVLTDSNRRRGLRWSGLHDRYGYTEVAGERPLVEDPLDQRLDVFTEGTDRARTVSVLRGVRSIRATTYGSPKFGYSPGQRPAAAFDGDRQSGWLVDSGLPVGPERLELTLTRPITTDRVGLLQPAKLSKRRTLVPIRFIRKIGLRFDDGPWIERTVPATTRTKRGGVVRFPKRTFEKLEIRIDDVSGENNLSLASKNPVGFNEITLRDETPGSRPVRVRESMLMPRDLLGSLGAKSADHPLRIVMTREATMDQKAMRRQFVLPTARTFRVDGTARLSAFAKDAAIDRTYHLPDAEAGGVTATSESRLGPVVTRASSAIDGDLSTAWVTPVGFAGSRLRVRLPAAATIDHLDLQVVADGRHSLPTRMRITTETGDRRTVVVPPLPADTDGDGVVPVTVRFAPVTGKVLNLRIRKIQPLRRGDQTLPVGFAEVGIPGVRRAPAPTDLPGECQTDILRVDGEPVGVRITGSVASADAGRALPLRLCDDGRTLTLGPGRHDIEVRLPPTTREAYDVARLVLASDPVSPAAGGATTTGAAAEPGTGASPRVAVVDEGRTSSRLRVTGADRPFWLVLGQSFNEGWQAKADGKDLGAPTLVDGYANGWRVPAARDGRPIEITLEWTPQRTVWIALGLSAAAMLLCLGIVLAAARGGRHRGAVPEHDDPPSLVWATDAAPVSRFAALLTALGCGVFAALVVTPWLGVLIAVLAGCTLWWPRWRPLLRILAAAVMLVVALGIPLLQLFRQYPGRFDWAGFFDWLRIPTWFVVLALGADAVIEVVVGRARARRAASVDAEESEPDPVSS